MKSRKRTFIEDKMRRGNDDLLFTQLCECFDFLGNVVRPCGQGVVSGGDCDFLRGVKRLQHCQLVGGVFKQIEKKNLKSR